MDDRVKEFRVTIRRNDQRKLDHVHVTADTRDIATAFVIKHWACYGAEHVRTTQVRGPRR